MVYRLNRQGTTSRLWKTSEFDTGEQFSNKNWKTSDLKTAKNNLPTETNELKIATNNYVGKTIELPTKNRGITND